ncbi:MAG: hypothetical protein QOD63_62 [Actinomycetota bacterium]|nr:hypothetical protein [Actinomycetota bacterium]
MAQVHAEADAVERLAAAYAGLADARRDAVLADHVPAPVSVDQLRLVVGA